MDKTFIVETSARHCHITAEAVEILYGKEKLQKGFTIDRIYDIINWYDFTTEITMIGDT